MKSPGSFEISVSWWGRECPADLQKDQAAKRFETLLKAMEQALAKARRGTDAEGLSALQKASEQLQTAAKPLVKVAETMAKSAGDKRKPLENTASALGRPLTRALEDAIAAIDVSRDDEDEDEDDDSQFGSAAAHAEYLTKRLRKVKKVQMNFAVTLAGTDPTALRMSFNRRKSASGQAKTIKKLCGGKQTTFGVAGTEDLSLEMTGEGVALGILVLALEGKMVPALAKRIKAAFRAMKIKVFKKVRILKDGVVLDEASEDDPDEVLPDLDDEGQDDGDLAGTAPTEQTATGPVVARKRALALRVRELSGLIVSQPDKLRQAMTPLLREAAEIINAAQDDADTSLDRAERILDALQKRMEQAAGEGSQQRATEARESVAKGSVSFAKARLLWAKSRTGLRSQIAALVKDIIDSCGDDPDFAEWRDEAKSLLVYAADFDATLEEALERLDDATTVEERQSALDEARDLLADHLEDLDDEFFAIAANATELPQVDVATARSTLRAIGQLLDRAPPEPVGG